MEYSCIIFQEPMNRKEPQTKANVPDSDLLNPALYGNAVTPLWLQATAIAVLLLGYVTLCHIRPGSGKVTARHVFWLPMLLLFMGSWIYRSVLLLFFFKHTLTRRIKNCNTQLTLFLGGLVTCDEHSIALSVLILRTLPCPYMLSISRSLAAGKSVYEGAESVVVRGGEEGAHFTHSTASPPRGRHCRLVVDLVLEKHLKYVTNQWSRGCLGEKRGEERHVARPPHSNH